MKFRSRIYSVNQSIRLFPSVLTKATARDELLFLTIINTIFYCLFFVFCKILGFKKKKKLKHKLGARIKLRS